MLRSILRKIDLKIVLFQATKKVKECEKKTCVWACKSRIHWFGNKPGSDDKVYTQWGVVGYEYEGDDHPPADEMTFEFRHTCMHPLGFQVSQD